MLSCNDVRRRLSDALDGNVSWWTRAQLRVHLAMCDECSRVARSLRDTVEFLRSMRDEAESVDGVDGRANGGGE